MPCLRLKDCRVAALLAMTQKWQVFRENLPFLFPNCLRFVAERHRHSVPPGRCTMRPRKDNAEGWIVLVNGNSDSIARAVQRGILFQIEIWKSQESFTYFKIFKPISWGKRPAERRCRLIQRFLILESVKKLEELFIAPTARQILHETAQRACARCKCA